MTLQEWRKNGERRSMALDVLNSPTMQEMLAVMESEHPAKLFMPLRDGFDAALNSGVIRGYQMALNSLRSFAEAIPEAPESIKTTWGHEDPA